MIAGITRLSDAVPLNVSVTDGGSLAQSPDEAVCGCGDNVSLIPAAAPGRHFAG